MTSEEFLKRVADSKVPGQVQLTATEIRHNLHDAMGFLEAGGTAVVVTKHGKEVFRMVPPTPAPTPPPPAPPAPVAPEPKPENVDANGSPVFIVETAAVGTGVTETLAAA